MRQWICWTAKEANQRPNDELGNESESQNPNYCPLNFILAIDQSTSATKGILFDAGGTVIDRASRDHRQIYPQPGWVEHDAEEIWRNVLTVIRAVSYTHLRAHETPEH